MAILDGGAASYERARLPYHQLSEVSRRTHTSLSRHLYGVRFVGVVSRVWRLRFGGLCLGLRGQALSRFRDTENERFLCQPLASRSSEPACITGVPRP